MGIKELIFKDRNLKFILAAGIIIQLIFSITASGYYHFDQHFQIIEFSSYHAGDRSLESTIWEFTHPVRPGLQIYLFTAWDSAINFLGIRDAYSRLAILRIILGLLMYIVFSILSVHYFRNEKKIILYSVLLILNFSWFLPYTKTLFSSEILSALFFFGAVFGYDIKKDKNPGIVFLLLIGFLLSLAFYFRFQTFFLLAGFGIWLIGFEKKINHIVPVASGFIAGVLLNTWLDYEFYNSLVITPYEYYYVNIIDKRAANFSTSSFLKYIGLLIAVITVPPLSILLYYYAVKSFFKKYKHWLFISPLLFIIAHCFLGHKEERFLFPVLYIMPVWIGWGLPAFLEYYAACKKAIRGFIKGIIIFSVCINCMLLILLMFIPYSQPIHFTALLNRRFNKTGITNRIYCLDRTPFETPSKAPLVYYEKNFRNLEIIRLSTNDSLKYLQGDDFYIAATFDRVKDDRKMIDSLGYQPVLYSSRVLWKINEYLQTKKIHTINDIWVLYGK